MTNNPWELYSSMPGWEAVSDRLDSATNAALVEMDRNIAGGATIPVAAVVAFKAVSSIMAVNSEFGALDSEPRGHLGGLIGKHIRLRYGVTFLVDRFGDCYEA